MSIKTKFYLTLLSLGPFGYGAYRLYKRFTTARCSGYERVSPLADYAPWRTNGEFLQAYEQIKRYTLVDVYRCFELWTLVEQSRYLKGNIIEVGVWRGGTGALLAKAAELNGIKDTVYLCDTFSGVVKAGCCDSRYQGGEHADTSRKTVERLLYGRFGLKNVKILEGVFPDETSKALEHNVFRLCHIDVDVYRSAKDVTEWIWKKMVTGGIIVYDDYGFFECSGVTKYVEELRHRGDRLILHNLNGHAVMIRI